jgi:hypothetical protein
MAPAALVVINGVNSFSPRTLVDQSAPLPIELLSFDARYGNGEVNLRWATETELNNDFFTIERSETGERFSELARVAGSGTTNLPTQYETTDSNPIPCVSYYRLKQTDYDGKFSYSAVVRVEVDASDIWSVVPNPNAGESFAIRFAQSQLQPVGVQISDVGGRLVFRAEFEAGASLFEVEPTQKLAAGVYIVSVLTDGRINHQRLVVR